MSFSESNPNPNLGTTSGKDLKSKRNAYKFQGGNNTINNDTEPDSAVRIPPPPPPRRGGKKFPPVPEPRPESQTVGNFEPFPNMERRAPQLSKIVGNSADSNGSPRPGLYFKKASTSTGSQGNGIVSAANANGRTQRIRRQQSLGTFGPQSSPTMSSEALDEFEIRPTLVLDPEKIEAAQKRLLEAKLKKTQEETTSKKKNWKQRFKLCGTTIVSLTIILSGSSLLFVVPIIVDPILVGLDAQFSPKPVLCKTVSYENETGPMNCAMPSCREGCTADLYACIFVSVVYTKETLSVGTSDAFDNSSIDEDFSISDNATFTNGTLFINPSGCGYPPEVNCSTFEKKFREIGTVFPCYYSSSNSSLVVPFYSRHEELINLTFALGIPFGLLFVASVILFLLLRWDLNRVRDIAQDDEVDNLDNLEAWRLSSSESTEILTPGNSKRNGKPKCKYNRHGPGGGQNPRDKISRSKSLENSSALQQETMLTNFTNNSLMNGTAGISNAVVTVF